ncbi:MAG: hypothetical protein ACRCSE_01750 [Vibrio sp.]
MTDDRKRKQAAQRAQRLRDKRKQGGERDIRVSLSELERQKLSAIGQFFGYPHEPVADVETLQSLIHRVHAEIAVIEQKLGKCGKCGEQLPQGCAKLHERGLFNGDAQCWHTVNRLRLIPLKGQ